jgi:orotidine-5'-phosphate decarboxylase
MFTNQLQASERLIVALDVPSIDDAIRVVDTLDNVSFFKVGWQLFITGNLFELVKRISEKQVFVDLKIPGDIGNTIGSVVAACTHLNVKFLTLSESVPLATIESAKIARGHSETPKLLTVPFLSSLDAGDLWQIAPSENNLSQYILKRARNALNAGCDGVIASGKEIKLCRDTFPEIIIVSPGIRPEGAQTDDHKRHTTPSEAIKLGADYLVVGRPILKSPNPKKAAERIIIEMDAAFRERCESSQADSEQLLRACTA